MTLCVIAMLLPSHCSALFPTGNFHYLIICIVFSSHYLLQIVLKDNLKNSTKLSSAFELLKFSFQQNSMFDQNDPVCHCYAAVSPLHNAQIVNQKFLRVVSAGRYLQKLPKIFDRKTFFPGASATQRKLRKFNFRVLIICQVYELRV